MCPPVINHFLTVDIDTIPVVTLDNQRIITVILRTESSFIRCSEVIQSDSRSINGISTVVEIERGAYLLYSGYFAFQIHIIPISAGEARFAIVGHLTEIRIEHLISQ